MGSLLGPMAAIGMLLQILTWAALKLSLPATSCAALLYWRSGLSVGARQLAKLITSSKAVWIVPWRMLTIRWVIVLLMLTPSLLSLADGASTRESKWIKSHQKGAGEWVGLIVVDGS